MTQLKLEKLQKFSGRPGPLVLIIMDGIGLGKENEFNAFHLANTPDLDMIQKEVLKNSKRILAFSGNNAKRILAFSGNNA